MKGYNVTGVELISAGVVELLKSSEVQACLDEKAREIQARCGEGYETNSGFGHDRAYVNVRAVTREARTENLRNNTLLKNLF